MPDRVISIAVDYSKSPGGRFRSYGPFSGEEFRDDVLLPALRSALADGSVVIVELDGTFGYPASFLEEAFGGLVRRGFSRIELERHLRLKADSPHMKLYKSLAEEYIREAKADTQQEQSSQASALV